MKKASPRVAAQDKAHRKVVRPNPAYRPWPQKVKNRLQLAVIGKTAFIIIEVIALLGWPWMPRVSLFLDRLTVAAEELRGVAI